MVKYWMAVVQLPHVLRGVELGIAQTNHGAKAGLLRMTPDDGFLLYSPKSGYPDGPSLKAFTAIGSVADGAPWQAEDGDFRPWRRTVNYDRAAVSVPIAPLLDVLDLTRGNSHWGIQLRRGLLEISAHDFALVAQEMGAADSLAPTAHHSSTPALPTGG